MKKLIIAVLFLMAINAYSQVTLTKIDTSGYVTLPKAGNMLILMSNNTNVTDSINVYSVFSAPYREVLMGVVRQSTRALGTMMIGISEIYGLNTLGSSQLLFRYAVHQTDSLKSTFIEVRPTDINLIPIQ